MDEVLADMKNHLGMMVPIWFPEDYEREKMRSLLRMTLWDAGHFLDWQNVITVIDGADWTAPVVEKLQKEFKEQFGGAFEIVSLPENQGKGLTVAAGFEHLLEREHLHFFCIRDDDNDHSIYDLPHLVRTHRQITEDERNPLVLVIGRRRDLRRPLGMWRAEFEAILCYVEWESVKFHLAQQGKTLNSQWLSAYGWIPDLESGYKVYSREAAQLAVTSIRKAAEEHEDLQMGRFGVETVPNIELLAAGGIIGETSRLAHEDQPLTTFASGTPLPRLYANQSLFVFRRLEIPAEAARQLVDNSIPRTLLARSSEGLQLANEYRSLVFEGIGLPTGVAEQSISIADFF